MNNSETRVTLDIQDRKLKTKMMSKKDESINDRFTLQNSLRQIVIFNDGR